MFNKKSLFGRDIDIDNIAHFFVKHLLFWGILLSILFAIAIGLWSKNITIHKDIANELQRASEFLKNTPSEVQEIKEAVPSDRYVIDAKYLPPEISAKAYIIADLTTDKVVYSKNENVQLPPASVTKIMTAIITMEDYDLSQPITVTQKCVGINGSNVGFKVNDQFTVEDLLYGLLVKSGADAACTIANIDDEQAFINKMNDKAVKLGMLDTKFQNEIGFDSENQHLTTVADLKKLAEYALKFSTFRKIVGTKKIELRTLNNSFVYNITNTNDLLFSIPGTVGIKTGTTEYAGQCLAYLYENKGKEILIISLGSQDRFKDTTTLLDWTTNQIDRLKLEGWTNEEETSDIVSEQPKIESF